MSDHLDRVDLVRTVLQAELRSTERRTLCACIGLADCDGVFPLDVGLLAPMSGNRRPYVRAALEILKADGWFYRTGENTGRLRQI